MLEQILHQMEIATGNFRADPVLDGANQPLFKVRQYVLGQTSETRFLTIRVPVFEEKHFEHFVVHDTLFARKQSVDHGHHFPMKIYMESEQLLEKQRAAVKGAVAVP